MLVIRNFLKRAFLLLLASLILFASEASFAGRKLASLRRPPPKREGPRKPVVLTEAHRAALTEARLASLVARLNKLKTLKDFEQAFLSHLEPDDRASLLKSLEGFKPPKVKQSGRTLTFHWDKGVVTKLEWPDMAKPNIRFGTIDWVLTKKPVSSQVALLTRKIELEAVKGSNASYKSLIIPTANANLLRLGLKGLGTVIKGVYQWSNQHPVVATLSITTATTAAYKGYCWVTTGSAFASMVPWAQCTDYLEEIEKKNRILKEKAPEVNAAKVIREHVNDTKVDWFASTARQCPALGDKEKNVYVADVVEVKHADGQWVPQADWFTVKMEFSTTDSIVKEGLVVKRGTDLGKPVDVEANLYNRLRFDEKGLLKEIEVPNPKHDPNDPGSKAYTPVDMVVDDSKLEPDMKARREKMKSLVVSINDFVKNCMKHQQVENYLPKDVKAEVKAPPKEPVPAQADSQQAPVQQAPPPDPAPAAPQGGGQTTQ